MTHQHTELGVACTHVMTGGRPIVFVARHTDGTWDFLCEQLEHDDTSELKTVCFECARKRDPSIAPLANLEPGAEAERSGPDGPWQRTDRN